MGIILVVDDDQATREMLVEALGGGEHTILAATNGREALALAQAHRPQLIIADLLMPELDGYALVAALLPTVIRSYLTEDEARFCDHIQRLVLRLYCDAAIHLTPSVVHGDGNGWRCELVALPSVHPFI